MKRAAPWLWVVGPLVAAIFPPSIPLLIALAIHQLTEGGEGVRAYMDARTRARAPMPVLDTPEEGPTKICVRCFEPAVYSPRRDQWRHVMPSDACTDPALTLKGGLDDA